MASSHTDTDTDTISFGTRLRALLNDGGISQAQLARDCGLDRSEINRLCNDKRDPRPHEIVRIGRALGLDAEALLAGVELPSEIKEVRAELERISTELLEIEQERDAAVAALETERNQASADREEWERERDDLHEHIAALREEHAKEKEAFQLQAAQQSQLLTDQLTTERERSTSELASHRRTAAQREQQLLGAKQEAQDAERRAKAALAGSRSRVQQLQTAVHKLQGEISKLRGQRVLTGVLGALGGIMLGAAGSDPRDGG